MAQCKMTAGLTKGEESPLGETIEQVVRFVVGTSEPLDPLKTTLVLAVADDAPRTLDQLETGCRAFDTGGSWSDVLATLSEAQNLALASADVLESQARELEADFRLEVAAQHLIGERVRRRLV